MSNVNGYLIQERFKQLKYVTVPWIQKEYGLDYKDAKEFLTVLQGRGWIEAIPKGVKYLIIHDNLQLRKIIREEVEELIEDINSDCIKVLKCIQKVAAHGATYSDIKKAVQGDNDTRTALNILDEHSLIYSFNDIYFITISNNTIDVLSDVEKWKRRNEASRWMSGKVEDNKQLEKLFDVLFEDQ